MSNEPPVIVLETDRLLIRRARPVDAGLLLALWTDPRVMTNVGFPAGLRITLEQIEESIAKQDEGPFDKYLIVERRSDGVSIGECKLGTPDEDGISETDVKLVPEAWGNGFGTEVKRALVEELFRSTDCRAVQGTPNKANVASIRMQEAVGGIRVSEGVFEPSPEDRDWMCPVPHYVYRVFRPEP